MAQFWINNDQLPLQFGPDKARIDLGGDFSWAGPNRLFETYISLGTFQNGTGSITYPGLPSSFTGTNPATAGIVSMNTLFPLQPIAPTTAANSSGVLVLANPQLYIDQVDLECLVSANAGTGGATGLTGIGLATISSGAFVQVTPNAGVQLVGAITNAQMSAGKHFSFYADGSAFGTGTPPTAGSWLGNVPLVTNSITPLPTHGYVSALATGGTYSGSSGGGLLKLRVYYNYYGSINQ